MAAPQTGCDVHLALLTIWESGSAEYNGRENWHYRRGRRDSGVEENASEFEVVELHDWSKTLADWRRPDGSATTLGKLPLEDNEVSPPDALEDMEPDEEHFHEATGNEGASVVHLGASPPFNKYSVSSRDFHPERLMRIKTKSPINVFS